MKTRPSLSSFTSLQSFRWLHGVFHCKVGETNKVPCRSWLLLQAVTFLGELNRMWIKTDVSSSMWWPPSCLCVLIGRLSVLGCQSCCSPSFCSIRELNLNQNAEKNLVPCANMEGEGFVTYSATSHRGSIQMFWLHSCRLYVHRITSNKWDTLHLNIMRTTVFNPFGESNLRLYKLWTIISMKSTILYLVYLLFNLNWVTPLPHSDVNIRTGITALFTHHGITMNSDFFGEVKDPVD